jgi:mono/diheme cytochrome c family protein
VHVRSILTGILPFLLGGVLVTACDKQDAKTDEKKVDAKADDKKAADLKAAEAKAAEAKALEAKAVEDAKALEAKALADAKADDAGAADAADEGKAADDGEPGDTKADPDTKAVDTKADPDTKGEKKGDDKADTKKADDKAEPAAPKLDGKKLYADKCASCHGGSGKADTKLGEKHKIPSWAEPGWKGKWSLSKVEDIVTKGKADTKMKAFAGKLTPEEIKAVSKYARDLGK